MVSVRSLYWEVSMKRRKPRLVQEAADKLRDIILEHEPDGHIGSLNEVADLLGVGIVTVQQAARILEHEGFLNVRRGPGGGYYGARPDEADVARALSVYLRANRFGYHEVTELTVLLDAELASAAASGGDEQLLEEVRRLLDRVDECDTRDQRLAFETDLRNLMFRVVRRPLIELMSRVTTEAVRTQPALAVFEEPADVDVWKLGRKRMLRAIFMQDAELAQFEAERHRREVIKRIRRQLSEAAK